MALVAVLSLQSTIGREFAVHTADRAIRDASRRRVQESLAWARRIGAAFLILHSTHLPMINEARYDRQWLSGWLDFLGRQDFGDVTVVLENMWDRTPDLMVRLVEEFGSPRLRLCLDVAHWNVYGAVSPVSEARSALERPAAD
ncbi:sugar phosphate isomerase/epimerase (plasmid) [Embleya sp. NBC_00888]|nr:sugar phosphate isomerase/epimerase [Embleya sp. NBC_00888]